MPIASADRIAYWPTIAAVLWPAALILVWSGPFDMAFFGGPLVLLLWGVSATLGAVVALIRCIDGAWRRALSTLVLPLTTIVATLNLGFVWDAAITAGDYVHVTLMRPLYLAEVSRLAVDGPRLVVFDWGGFAGVTHAAVYDESDEIMLSHPSEAWKARASHTLLDCGIVDGAPAGGHFYIVRIAC